MDHRAGRIGQKIRAGFEEDIVAIYNIFAPVTYFKWLVGEVSGGDDLIANFIDQDAVTLKKSIGYHWPRYCKFEPTNH